MCKQGQNRIDYIVLHRPEEAAKLLEKHGYEAPKKLEELPKAMKVLVKRKGEPIIKELLQIHPEKQLLLEISGHNSNYDEYCGCQSHYSGDTKELLDKISEVSVADLELMYDDAKKGSRERPDDKSLAAQVELVWDELRRRKKRKEHYSKQEQASIESFWLKLGLAFLAGIVIAKIA